MKDKVQFFPVSITTFCLSAFLFQTFSLTALSSMCFYKRLLERGYNKRDFYRTLSQLRTIHTRPRGNFIRRSAVYAVRAILKVFPKNFFVKKIVKVAKSFKTETGYIGNFTGYERIL